MGAPERRSLMRLFQPNHRPPLAVSVRPHTPNCRASGRQRQHADQKTHSPSARRMKVSRVPRVLLEVLIGRALLEVLIGRQQLSAV